MPSLRATWAIGTASGNNPAQAQSRIELPTTRSRFQSESWHGAECASLPRAANGRAGQLPLQSPSSCHDHTTMDSQTPPCHNSEASEARAYGPQESAMVLVVLGCSPASPRPATNSRNRVPVLPLVFFGDACRLGQVEEDGGCPQITTERPRTARFYNRSSHGY